MNRDRWLRATITTQQIRVGTSPAKYCVCHSIIRLSDECLDASCLRNCRASITSGPRE